MDERHEFYNCIYDSGYRNRLTSNSIDINKIVKEFPKIDDKQDFIRVPKVIGRSNCQSLIEFDLDFPSQYPAVELKDSSTQIRDLKFKVCKNKVIVNGILYRSINYKSFGGTYRFKYNGSDLKAVFGSIKNISVSIPFSNFIDVPGTIASDEIELEFAGVEASCESDILSGSFRISKSKVLLYKCLKERVIVIVKIKVLRQTYIEINSYSDYLKKY